MRERVDRSSQPMRMVQVRGWVEVRLERGMRNFMRAEYGGVTETWNVIQHEVNSNKTTITNILNLARR